MTEPLPNEAPAIIVKPAGTLMLHTLIATLSDADEERFECCMVNTHTPAIKDLKTGEWVIFPWNFLAGMASESLSN
jgi:hypothetical protein